VLVRFVLAFELTECCAFFCWVVLSLVRLLARFHCLVDVGVGLSWMRCFYFGVQVVGQVALVLLGPVCCGFSYLRLCGCWFVCTPVSV